MENRTYEVEICQGHSFDLQSAIQFTFDNWVEAQKFIELSLKHSLIVQIQAVEEE